MFKSWLVYVVASSLTGSPLLGLLAVALLWYGGSSLWAGRLWNPLSPFQRLFLVSRLRGELAQNPHNLNVRAELGGLLARRSPREAAELLTEVTQRAPELPLPHYFLGLARLGLGDTAGGAAAIEAALKLRRDLRYGEPLVALGDHHYVGRRFSDALAAYQRATDVHSSHAEAWYKSGLAARACGDLSAARAHFRETLASTEQAPAFKRRLDRSWRWRAWWQLRRS